MARSLEAFLETLYEDTDTYTQYSCNTMNYLNKIYIFPNSVYPLAWTDAIKIYHRGLPPPKDVFFNLSLTQ